MPETPTANLEEFNPGEFELIHAIHVRGGQVPRRVRAFINHMVVYTSESPLFRDVKKVRLTRGSPAS